MVNVHDEFDAAMFEVLQGPAGSSKIAGWSAGSSAAKI